MTPALQVVLALCVVAVSAVLVVTLLAVRKLAQRADTVLAVVEREIRPMLNQVEALTAELRELSQGAGEDLKRIRVVVGRAEEVSLQASQLAVSLGSLTRYGQYASMALGLKRGISAFVRMLRAPR
jgi:uncharacterized protein YoxC